MRSMTILSVRSSANKDNATQNWSDSYTHQSSFWLDQRPVLSVHLVVKAACIAEVVSCAVPSPERSAGSSTVDALPTLCQIQKCYNMLRK